MPSLESSAIIHFKAKQSFPPKLSSPPFLTCSLSPSSPCVFSCLSPPNKLPRHHHHLPRQCWLLSVPQVKAVLPCRGQKFKSSVYSQTFWESGQHHLAVLLYSQRFRQSTCDKKERGKLLDSGVFWMFRETTQSIDADLKLYLFSLVLHDFLCGCCTPFKISHLCGRCNGWVTC